MKKIILNSSLSVILALSIVACGSNSKSGMGNNEDNTTKDIKNPPIIKLEGSKEVKLIVGHEYKEDGVTVTGDINKEIKVEANTTIDIYKIGEQTIKYTVTDNNGKKASTTRKVIIQSIDEQLPIDTNLKYAKKNNEDGYIYFADPQSEEHGLNRVVRVNYKTMNYDINKDSLKLTNFNYLVEGKIESNPHSIDRAGDTNRFYVRTQNSYSFDIIKAEDGLLKYVKTVPLSVDINGSIVKYSPRAFGAYNKKYNIQILSGRTSETTNKHTIVGIVDVATDKVIKTVSYPITSDTGSTVTGHSKWLDEDHFAVIDRGNAMVRVYKISKDANGDITIGSAQEVRTTTPIHALERVPNPKNKKDLNTFYALGASSVINGKQIDPFVMKFIFNANSTEKLTRAVDSNGSELITWFDTTHYANLQTKQKPATTHHANISPDGKYIVVAVYDGQVYKVNRETMEIEAFVDAGTDKGLGAAHTEFSKSQNLAIVTNHWSQYVTIIDLETFKVKAYVNIYENPHPYVAGDVEKSHLMQPHFAPVSDDGKFFYTFANQDNGRFVKINLETIKNMNGFDLILEKDSGVIDDSFNVEGAPEQAHS